MSKQPEDAQMKNIALETIIGYQTVTMPRQMYAHYSVRYSCGLFRKSRQAWYVKTNVIHAQQLIDSFILKLVEQIRMELPRAGVPQLYKMLQQPMGEHGIKMGRDGLYRLPGTHGYLLRYRRRKNRML